MRTHKTRIIATIGPSSSSPTVMAELLRAGMDVARLNFSHGDFESHGRVVADLRAAAAATGRRLAIMADLPGPKIRLGRIASEPVQLERGGEFTLTTRDIAGDATGASVSFARLPQVARRGDTLFLNDGLIQLEVEESFGEDVRCRVVTGGELRSRKGLNLPGIDLGIPAFTEFDRACLRFAMAQGIDAVSQSFVSCAADIEAVRSAAAEVGATPLVIAKIERAVALEKLDEIIRAADGVMVARGDLGVELPIERMAVVQKEIIHRANVLGTPVITATHMLESMVTQRRPTRAEATDVANAILDGTDAVMLSGESAVGRYPVEAVEMLVRIAAEVEPHRPRVSQREVGHTCGRDPRVSEIDLVALSVAQVFERATPVAVFVPTLSGATARRIARFRLPVAIVAVSPNAATCQALQFSYGVTAVHRPQGCRDWTAFARSWLEDHGIVGEIALLIEGPSPLNPGANNRMEIITLRRRSAGPEEKLDGCVE